MASSDDIEVVRGQLEASEQALAAVQRNFDDFQDSSRELEEELEAELGRVSAQPASNNLALENLPSANNLVTAARALSLSAALFLKVRLLVQELKLLLLACVEWKFRGMIHSLVFLMVMSVKPVTI